MKSASILAVAKVVEAIIREIFRITEGDRQLEYSDGAVGVTSLIYCPLKAEFRERYPEIRSEGTEISDGFMHEKLVHQAICNLFGEKFSTKEYVLPYESVSGLKIECHTDIAMFGRKMIVFLECKDTKMTYHNMPYNSIKENQVLVWDPALVERINFSDAYVLQSKMQKFLAERNLPGQEIDHFILQKTMMKCPPFGLKKLYVLRQTTESMTQEEFEGQIQTFLVDKRPRYGWECDYCQYRKNEKCRGQEFVEKITAADIAELAPPVQDALQDYLKTFESLKDKEDYLKRALKGKVIRLGKGRGKDIGWVNKTMRTWDKRKVMQILNDQTPDYFQIDWRNQDELEVLLSSMGVDLSTVRTSEKKSEWRGL